MSLVDDIKALQANLIPDNTNNEISPKDVRDSLDLILDNLQGLGSNYYGTITPASSAITGIKDGGTVLPLEDGTYSNFGGLERSNELCVFVYESSVWIKRQIEELSKYTRDLELLSYIQYKVKNGDKIDLLYGKNIGSYINSVGGLTPNASSEYSEFVYVRPSSDYRYIGKIIGNVLYIAFYDKDFNFLSAVSDSGTILDFPFTTPSNAYYIRYSTFDYLTTKSYVIYEGSAEYKNVDKDKTINIIEISNTINDPTATPPVYSSIQSALNAITDNSEFNRYKLELLDGTHDANSILLKDYVDIVRSPKAVLPEVVIKHDFLNTQPPGERDLFKTNSDPYTAPIETFPLHVIFEDIVFKGKNLNYCIHADFNDSPAFKIIANRCVFRNDDPTTDVGASDYAIGIGIYGGQKIEFNDCDFYGRINPIVDLPQYHQSSGWVVHNRNAQNTKCNVTFNNCNHFGLYGGRVVDFGSGQNDSININGGVMAGTYGSILAFNDTGIADQSITVNCTAQLQRIQPQQEIVSPGGTRLLSKVKIISPFTEVYETTENINLGEALVYNGKFGEKVNKSLATSTNLYIVGVASSEVLSGEVVTVRKKGLAAIKYDAPIAANTPMTISDVNNGSFKAAGVSDKIFAITVNASSDTDNDEFNPGLVMANLL